MFTAETIDFGALTHEEIATVLAQNKIALTIDEALKIQHDILKRPPSLTELILWSIQGSEHCSYKSSRPFLKQFVTSGPDVILGPGEDAGIVCVATDATGKRYGIVMSHESHNHPSQIVPYEGAATGVGGNVRDIACMGAKVIANADPLRFGDITSQHTKWIHDNVVGGIAGYGNPIGVPCIAGDVYYDKSYNDNCLVNVVTLGVLREDEIIHSRAPKNAVGYDLILVGKPTDNSGFGGASFASLKLEAEKKEQNKGAVQEPNAFLERHLLKALYTLFAKLKQKNLLESVGFKDLGAGGVACAAVELADGGGYGADVTLELVHTSMDTLHPGVILCSETQERFMWVAPPDVTPLILKHFNEEFNLPNISKGARASVIGKIRNDDQFIVTYKGEEIVHAKASDVTNGLLYNRPYTDPKKQNSEPTLPEPKNYNEVFLKILSHENVASREPIYERYDKNVQGITVVEPGEADAGVLQPFKDEQYPAEIRQTGVALSVDHNPRYSQVSPYWGGVNAVVESLRNVAAVGATPVALTDNLNFGNPEKPEQMWEFVEGTRGVAEAAKALQTPIIAGNVSLYNESHNAPIAPSPVIACLGTLRDVACVTTMHFKQPNSVIFLIGERKDECGGSVYYALQNQLGAAVPQPNFTDVAAQISALTKAITDGLVLACHDISDGGVATTLAEMSFKNEIGCTVTIPGDLRSDKKLFGETGGFVIEVAAPNVEPAQAIFKKYGTGLIAIGKTNAAKKLELSDEIDVNLLEAKKAWANGLREKL